MAVRSVMGKLQENVESIAVFNQFSNRSSEKINGPPLTRGIKSLRSHDGRILCFEGQVKVRVVCRPCFLLPV